MIFAPGCDVDEATKIANRIMSRLSGQSLPLAGARFSVSIGIAVHDGAHADFDRMYRDADAALAQEGKTAKAASECSGHPMTTSISPID